jgi:hypothetical protein
MLARVIHSKHNEHGHALINLHMKSPLAGSGVCRRLPKASGATVESELMAGPGPVSLDEVVLIDNPGLDAALRMTADPRRGVESSVALIPAFLATAAIAGCGGCVGVEAAPTRNSSFANDHIVAMPQPLVELEGEPSEHSIA